MKRTILYMPLGILTATEYHAMCLNLWGEFIKALEEGGVRDDLANPGQFVSLEIRAGKPE